MSSTDIATRSPITLMVERVQSDDFIQQIAKAGIANPEKFARVAVTALLQSGEMLASCEPNSVYRALLRAAQDDLMPDGREAALVAYNTKIKGQNGQPDRWEARAQYLPMVGGLRKLAAEFAWTMKSGVVYENDPEFSFDPLDDVRPVRHIPVRPGVNKGPKIAAWAIAKNRDGRVIAEVMDAAEIQRARNVSRAKDRGPWVDWEDRMFEKTVVKRLFSKLPLASNDRITRVLAADIDPDEASASLYGPDSPPARQIAAHSTVPPTTGTPTAEQGGESQQAADTPPDPGVSAATGADDEPDLGTHQELNADEQAAIEAAANDAAMFELPTGKHAGKTLGEIAAIDGSDGWFVFALRKTDLNPTVSQNVWAFTRVYKPELFQQVLTEREAQAAA